MTMRKCPVTVALGIAAMVLTTPMSASAYNGAPAGPDATAQIIIPGFDLDTVDRMNIIPKRVLESPRNGGNEGGNESMGLALWLAAGACMALGALGLCPGWAAYGLWLAAGANEMNNIITEPACPGHPACDGAGVK